MSRDPKHNSSGSNATIMDECDCSVSYPMITKYTAKDASSVVTLNANANNILYQDNLLSNDMNDDDIVEAGNEAELLCTQVALLLKVRESNNSRNAIWKLLQ